MKNYLTNWQTSLAGMLLIVYGVVTTISSFKVPGMSMSPGEAIIVGLGLLQAKDGSVTGGTVAATSEAVKRTMVIAAAFLFGGSLLISEARAADMPVKAPSVLASSCTITSCTGFYAGVGFTGSGQNIDVVGGGVSQLFSAGAMMHIPVGYQVWNGRFFFAIEIAGGYDVAGMASKDGRWVATEMVKFGMGLDALFGGVPLGPASATQTPTPISIPASIGQSLMSPYIQVGGVQRPGRKGWGTGAGAEFVLAQNWNLDLQYIRAQYTDKTPDGAPLPTINEKSENMWRLALLRKF